MVQVGGVLAEPVRATVLVLALMLAGCTNAASVTGLDFLETQYQSADSSMVPGMVRAAAAQGLDPGHWPNGSEPVTDWLGEAGSYGDRLRLLAATADWLGPLGMGHPYVQAVLAGHDGEQFGSPALLTDDMLAVEALVLAGVPTNDSRIQDATSRIADAQAPNGGWRWDGGSGEVDETAWALVALQAAGALTPQARQAATDFLITTREPDGFHSYGGTTNCQSTALALVAWNVLGTTAPQATGDALRSCQNPDGGFGYLPGGPSTVPVTVDALIGLAP